MDFFETIAARYSVRGYKPDPVSDELLQKVLERNAVRRVAHETQTILLPPRKVSLTILRFHRLHPGQTSVEGNAWRWKPRPSGVPLR